MTVLERAVGPFMYCSNLLCVPVLIVYNLWLRSLDLYVLIILLFYPYLQLELLPKLTSHVNTSHMTIGAMRFMHTSNSTLKCCEELDARVWIDFEICYTNTRMNAHITKFLKYQLTIHFSHTCPLYNTYKQ